MADIDIIAKGRITPVQAEADIRVAESLSMYASGKITPVQASARVVIYSGGDRAPYTVDIDPLLAGINVIDSGPGLFIVGGCSKSHRVVLIDPTAFRRIRLAFSSEDLGLPVSTLQTTEDYIFAFLHNPATAKREVVILTNTVELEVVKRISVDNGDQSAWIAVREDADVVAFPTGTGGVSVHRASGDFALLKSNLSVAGETATAVWFRYALDERPESADISERMFYLYVAWKSGAKASVIRYRKYRDTVAPRSVDDIRWFGEADVEDAQAPVRFDNQGCSAFSGASVTNRNPITPSFDGAVEIAPGKWVTFWGYTNDNTAVADIPPATSGITRNRFIGASSPVAQELLPRLFAPGQLYGVIALFTSGEEVSWELRGHPGGGVATTDYTKEPDERALLAFSGFVGKQHPPTVYRYQSFDPLVITQTEAIRLGRIELNSAGFSIDRQLLGIHSELPNDSVPGNTHWWPRDFACRLEGGAVQGHGDEARVSRVLVDEWERELARGVLFNVPEFNITELPVNFADPADAQVGEQMGFEIGVNADGSVVCLSAEQYADPAFPYTRQGRVFVWLRNPDGSYRNTDIIYATDTGDPAWEPDANSAYFSRYTEVNPAGDRVFIGSKRGPGIAVFNIDEDGKATFNKTLTWPEYLDQPKGSRAHEARFDVTGKFHFLTTARFSRSGSVQPGTFHVLYSDDNWETWEVRQAGQTRPGALPTDVDNLQTLDVSRDGTTFVIGAWEINRLYVFRSTDGWLTYKSYELTAPPGVTQYNSAVSPFVPIEERIKFGISNGCSYDGFRVVAACNQSWDYVNGVPLPNDTADQTGTAWYWLYEYDTDTYSGPYQIMPPVDIPNPSGNTRFGLPTRMNAPGFRFNLSINTEGAISEATFIYGIHDDEIRQIAELTGPYTVATADTRWTFDADLFIGSNMTADNPDSGETNVGAFRAYRVSEVP